MSSNPESLNDPKFCDTPSYKRMRTSEKLYPDDVGELIAECRAISEYCDLYTLGVPGRHDSLMTGGCAPESGEFTYGVGYIPAQWVLHVLEKERQ